MQLIALTHEPQIGSSYIDRELAANARAARESGIRVHTLPNPLSDPVNALGWLDFPDGAIGVLSTYIQRIDTYAPLHAAAKERGIHLLHTPEQSSQLMEFGLFYERIADLTARSVVIEQANADQLAEAIDTLTFPVFTKGSIKSVKEAGWDACVAQTPERLRERAGKWDTVIAREILDLRTKDAPGVLFPHGREYRAYWLDSAIIGKDYYWDGHDPFGPLSAADELAVHKLIDDAARRMDAPFVTVDVGQIADGSWRVIELGDPQYSAICHMPRHLCWSNLLTYAERIA